MGYGIKFHKVYKVGDVFTMDRWVNRSLWQKLTGKPKFEEQSYIVTALRDDWFEYEPIEQPIGIQGDR